MSSKKVYVVGSTNQDIVVEVNQRPIFGQTMFGESLNYFQGGKGANQAIAAHKLGVETLFVSTVGDDAFGRSLQKELDSINLESEILVSPLAPTGVAIINVDAAGSNSIVVIKGANEKLEMTHVEKSLRHASAGDVLLLQNELNRNVLIRTLELGKSKELITILNAAPPISVSSFAKTIDYLIVNEHEAGISLELNELNPSDKEEIVDVIKPHLAKVGRGIVVTLGDKGVIGVIGDDRIIVESHKVNVVDTTGAGDCFCGVFAASLARGESTASAVNIANKAASISVQKLGASTSYPSQFDLGQQ